ncbi:MAG: hypothetical protein ACOCUV_01475 [bacterium]
MKKLFVPLLLSCLLASCDDEPVCCDHLAEFPMIQVFDANDEDLLDPNNENHYEHSGISLTTDVDESRKQLKMEIRRRMLSSVDSAGYIINVTDNEMIRFLSEPGTRNYYLLLNKNTVDTITLVINSSIRTEKILVNEMETELDIFLLTINKI